MANCFSWMSSEPKHGFGRSPLGSWRPWDETIGRRSALPPIGREQVSGSAHRADDRRMRGVRLDLPADPGNAHIDRTVERLGIARIGEIEQPLARENPLGVVRKGFEQQELRG